jgi:hypothetical protein
MAEKTIYAETNHITDFTNKPRFPVVDDPTGTPVDGYMDSDDIYNIAEDAADTQIALLGSVGDVVGPAGATDGNIALFDGVTGKLLKDGPAYVPGLAPVDPSIVDNIVVFADTAGTQKDSGYSIADLVASAQGDYTITTVTAAYVQLITDEWIICDKATPMTVTLLAATGSGHPIKVTSIGVGVVTLEVASSGTINAAATIVLNQWQTASLCDISSGMYIRELV